jgi:hypothetical protein
MCNNMTLMLLSSIIDYLISGTMQNNYALNWVIYLFESEYYGSVLQNVSHNSLECRGAAFVAFDSPLLLFSLVVFILIFFILPC